ncbi:NAD(P)-dependent oxidoreductase [Actinotalea sp. K2]|uniref:NAD(P)-dependent oxidoreductase n=1 Tax=Actinotalea sp. K2 TaxID=2939438 RepID=UPI002017E911|nr:NAD(P)H-binding protein [Actinotalea sp. K2]MCL3862874.1 NAD(P)H-binding protein [Actinotalea sp. K2]
MRVALLGATGRTGRHVLTTLLDHGHDVVVLVRDPTALGTHADEVEVVTGDSRDAAVLARLVGGADAVLSALGPSGREPALHRDTATALTEVMGRSGVHRFVGISGAGVDAPGDQKSRRDRLISTLLQRLGGQVVTDKPAELAVWLGSPLRWTLVRPPRLNDGPATGRVEHHAHRSARRTTMTRADLGLFVVRVLEEDLYPRQAPLVANA